MRIKLIADCINDLKTGMGNYVFNLADGLKERGANLTLINYKQSEQFNTELYPNILKDRFLHTYSWYLFLPFLIKKEAETVIHNPSQVPTFFSFNVKKIIEPCIKGIFYFAIVIPLADSFNFASEPDNINLSSCLSIFRIYKISIADNFIIYISLFKSFLYFFIFLLII